GHRVPRRVVRALEGLGPAEDARRVVGEVVEQARRVGDVRERAPEDARQRLDDGADDAVAAEGLLGLGVRGRAHDGSSGGGSGARGAGGGQGQGTTAATGSTRAPRSWKTCRDSRSSGVSACRTRNASSPRVSTSAGYPWLRKCTRSEEHTSELQSRENLVCRLLLEKKK